MRYQTIAQENSTFCQAISTSFEGIKNILLDKWHLIQKQPNLREIFKDSPLISYRKGKSLKDILVKAKL